MRLEDLLLAGLIFTVTIFSGITFYGNMVTDYVEEYNSTNQLNSSGEMNNWQYNELLSQVENTTDAAAVGTQNATGILGGVRQIPIIGGTVVQVFSPLQAIMDFVGTMYDSFNIGMNMVSVSFNMLGFQVPEFVKTAIYSAITISVMFAIVALIWKWRG